MMKNKRTMKHKRKNIICAPYINKCEYSEMNIVYTKQLCMNFL